MENKVKTQKQIDDAAEKEAGKIINRAKRSLTTKVKNQCVEMGLNCVKNQLEFLRKNKTLLPDTRLNQDQTIECFELGIEKYKENYIVQ